jgi:hypothetical protein
MNSRREPAKPRHLSARDCAWKHGGPLYGSAGRCSIRKEMPAENANVGTPDRFEIHDNGAAFWIRWKWPRSLGRTHEDWR